MSIEFGWWVRDPEQGKYQINVVVHGGQIVWTRHQGHHTSWIKHLPSEEDRARLVSEAEKRVPRRLINDKQFDEIKRLSETAGVDRLPGRRVTGLGPSYEKYEKP